MKTETWLAISLILNFFFVFKWLSGLSPSAKAKYDLEELTAGDVIIIDDNGKERTVKVKKNDDNLRVITLIEKSGGRVFEYNASYNDDIFQNRTNVE